MATATKTQTRRSASLTGAAAAAKNARSGGVKATAKSAGNAKAATAAKKSLVKRVLNGADDGAQKVARKRSASSAGAPRW